MRKRRRTTEGVGEGGTRVDWREEKGTPKSVRKLIRALGTDFSIPFLSFF